jgi:hypothetical protein
MSVAPSPEVVEVSGSVVDVEGGGAGDGEGQRPNACPVCGDPGRMSPGCPGCNHPGPVVDPRRTNGPRLARSTLRPSAPDRMALDVGCCDFYRPPERWVLAPLPGSSEVLVRPIKVTKDDEEVEEYDKTTVPPRLERLSLVEWQTVVDTLYPTMSECWEIVCCVLWCLTLPILPGFSACAMVFPPAMWLFRELYTEEERLMRARDKLNKRVLGPKGMQLGFVGSGANPMPYERTSKGGSVEPFPVEPLQLHFDVPAAPTD